MRLLLDTHSFLWFIAGSELLSESARLQIADLDNQAFVSIASLWEIAIKTSTGKLTLARPFEVLIPEQLELNEIEILPIKLNHLAVLTKLARHHRDPFDRLLVAQSASEPLVLLTADAALARYGDLIRVV